MVKHVTVGTCRGKKIAFALSLGAPRRRVRTMGKSTPTIISLTNEFSTCHLFSCQMSRIRTVLDACLIFLVVGKHASDKRMSEQFVFTSDRNKIYKIIVIKSDKTEFDKTIQ